MEGPPRWLVRALTGVANVLARARRRLLPSHIAAVELGTASWVAQALAAFCELHLPEALAGDAKSPADLASEGYGDADKIFRLLRALAGYGVVRHLGGGMFTLGHVGKGLVGPRSTAPMVRYANAPWHSQAYSYLAESIRGHRSGFDLAHGKPLFAFLANASDAGIVFDAAMQSLTGIFAEPFARAYDFSAVACAVDVGGGTGALLATVLARFPQLHGIVFELPPVAERARSLALLRGLEQRLRAVDGNILVDAPPVADAYILSHVLHDWDDAACVRMLQNVRKSMRPSSRVLVYETVVPPPNNAWSQDRLQDIEMLAMLPGRERTREEYASLFALSGLRLSRVIRTAAAESIVEGVPT